MNIIDNAKKRILQHGMTKYESINTRTEAVCMIGAILYGNKDLLAGNHSEDYVTAQKIITGVITTEYPERLRNLQMSIPSFNDHKDTTLEDVVRVFEKASAQFEEQV